MNRNLKSTNSSISSKLFLKRILITLLTTTLLTGALPQTATAAATTFSCSLGGTYTITDGVVANGKDCAGELNIGSTATSIASGAFEWNSPEITSIVLPDSLISIGFYAFSNLQKITSLTIPKNVTTMYGASFFSGDSFVTINVDSANPSFSSVDGVLYDKNKTKIIMFPSGKDFSNWSMPTTVTTIGDQSFAGNQKITRLSIPNGVTTIEGTPFNDSRNLAEVVFPSSVIEIQAPQSLSWNNPGLKSIEIDSNNLNYSSADGVLFNKNKTILLRYPQGKPDISYTIPTTVETLYQASFAFQSDLKTLILPNSLKTILDATFWGTYALTSIDIPQSVTSISTSSLFYGSAYLESINVAANNPNYKSVDGVLFSKDGSVLVHYPAKKIGESYNVPSQVKTISEWAFESAPFRTVNLPEGLTEIQEYAFYQSELKTITIPNSVTTLAVNSIGGIQPLKSYKYCSNTLTQATLDNAGLSGKPNLCGLNAPGTPSIGTVAATGATSATIEFSAPASNGGSAITSYTATSIPGGVTGTIEQAGSGMIEVSGLNPATSYTFTVVASNVVGDSVESSSSNAITTEPTSITIPCGGTGTYMIEDGVARNGIGCKGDLTLSDKVRVLGSGAFEQSSALKSITLPKSVETIEPQAFTQSRSLKTINVDSANTNFSSVDGILYNKDKTKLICVPSSKDLSDFSISTTVKTIGSYAISNNESLIKFSIPNGITDLEANAINNNYNLRILNISKSVKSMALDSGSFAIGNNQQLIKILVDPDNNNYSSLNGVLFNKDKTTLLTYPKASRSSSYIVPSTVENIGLNSFQYANYLTAITLPDKLTDIGSNAFFSSQLEKILIPSTVKNIGEGAFRNLNRLESITVAPTNQIFTSIDGVLFNKDETTLIIYPRLKTGNQYVIPATVKTIGDSAFYSSTLTSVVLPDGLTEIGENAFSYMQSLRTIKIPDSVKIIKNYAFAGSVKNTITIPNDVTTVGYQSIADESDAGFIYCGSTLKVEDVSSENSNKPNLCGKEILGAPKSASATTVDESTAKIKFTAPKNNDESPILSYTVISNAGDETTLDASLFAGEINVTGLKPSTRYTFTVVATNIAGDSTASDISNAIITSASSSPEVATTGTFNIPCGGDATYKITNGVVSGGASCSGDLVIDSRATSIGDSAFSASKLGAVTLPDSIKSIGNWTFAESSLTSLNIPKNVTSIGEGFLGVASKIKTISIPKSVKTIGLYAFYITKSLENITVDSDNPSYTVVDGALLNKAKTKILSYPAARAAGSFTTPESVVEIADYAFYGSAITSITIPKDLLKIDYAFGNNASLASIVVDSTNPNYSSVDGWLYNSDKTILIMVPADKNLSNIVIPNGIKTVNYSVFGNLAKTMKTLSIPASVVELDPYQISEATSLSSITVDPDNANYTAVDGVLFNKDKSELLAYPAAKSGSSYTIPNSVISMPNFVLAKDSNLTSINIPESTVNITGYSFSGATSLVSINIDAANPNYSSVDGVLYDKDVKKLIAYPQGKPGTAYVVPEGVISIGNSAFSSNKNLKSITTPNSLLSIGYSAFGEASSLKTISLKENILQIANDAFTGTVALGYQYCAKEYSISEISDQNTGLEGMKNLCGKSLPGTVNIGAATATGTTTATVAFTAPASDGGSPVISYTAISNTGVATTLKSSAASGEIVITGLAPATSYTFKLIATNLVGDSLTESAQSNSISTLKLTADVENFANLSVAFGASPLTITAPKSNSDGVWSYTSSDSKVVAVNGSTLEIVKGGSVTITATQAATAMYASTTKTFTVEVKPITATLGVFAPIATTASGQALAITAPTSTSTGAWSYTLSDPTLGTVTGSSIVFTKAGTTTIVATQAATDSYLAGTVTTTVEVKPIAATLGALAPIATTASGLAIMVTAPTSTSTGAWSYTLSNPTLGTVTGSSIIFTKAGTTTIVATQAATDSYLAGSVSTTVTVKPYVMVKASKRTINVTVKGAKAVVKINGKAAKAGVNKVKAGKNLVTVTVGGVKVYTKTFKVK